MQLTRLAAKCFTLLIRPCPPGHVLNATGNTDEYDCKCDDHDQSIQSCLSTEKLVLQVNCVVLRSAVQCSGMSRLTVESCKAKKE